MRIIIFGGIGFIGSNMCIEAINRGHSVIAVDNMWRPNVNDNLRHLQETYKDKFEFVWGDVRNPEDFENEKLNSGEAIIMLAANPGAITSVLHPIYDFRSNAMGTFNALEFARKRNLPFVYASTTKTMSDIVNTFPMAETATRYILTGIPDNVKDGLDVEG